MVQQERDKLLRELHAELDLERKNFEARKPFIMEEVRENMRREESMTATTS